MANLNLSQSTLERKRSESNSIFDRHFMIPMSLIILSFGTLFGLKIYDAALKNEVASLDASSKVKLSGLESESVNRLVDFQARSEAIDAKLKAGVSPQDMFATIEKLMVGGVSLDSYNYDMEARTVAMKVISSDFKSIAQQAMNFKTMGSFKSVVVSDSAKKDDGTVVSNILISL